MYKENLTNETTIFNKEIIHYKKIDSTQKEIWRRIENGNIQNGTIIISDIQTDGIGTHGRRWYTTEENNIAFSFVIFPYIQIEKLENLTTEIAEIIVQVFKENYDILVNIKTPNDLIVKDKKIGGILTESKTQGNIVKTLVIGIGINTNQILFNKDIEKIATSIKNEFGITINNMLIIKEFIKRFEKIMLKRMGEIR